MPCTTTQSSDRLGPIPQLLNSTQKPQTSPLRDVALHPTLSPVLTLFHRPFPSLPTGFLQTSLLHSCSTNRGTPGKPPVPLARAEMKLAAPGPTLRSRERSKGPRASVAAWPARSTRQAERLRWMLHTFSRRNFPSSVGPTTRLSPSRQIPLAGAQRQDRARQETGRKMHRDRLTQTPQGQGGERLWAFTQAWDQLTGTKHWWGQGFPTVGAKATLSPLRIPNIPHTGPASLPHCVVFAGETAVATCFVLVHSYPNCPDHSQTLRDS